MRDQAWLTRTIAELARTASHAGVPVTGSTSAPAGGIYSALSDQHRNATAWKDAALVQMEVDRAAARQDVQQVGLGVAAPQLAEQSTDQRDAGDGQTQAEPSRRPFGPEPLPSTAEKLLRATGAGLWLTGKNAGRVALGAGTVAWHLGGFAARGARASRSRQQRLAEEARALASASMSDEGAPASSSGSAGPSSAPPEPAPVAPPSQDAFDPGYDPDQLGKVVEFAAAQTQQMDAERERWADLGDEIRAAELGRAMANLQQRIDEFRGRRIVEPPPRVPSAPERRSMTPRPPRRRMRSKTSA